MGLIVDIVPNHMGIGPENPYWDDVLTHGERSRYAEWFDIDWAVRLDTRQIVLPVLGDDLDRVLERGELELLIGDDGDLRLAYFTHSFPIDPASLPPGAAADDDRSRRDGRARDALLRDRRPRPASALLDLAALSARVVAPRSARRSTIAASSTSTILLACASRTERCFARRTR